ncbi:MAG: HipA N-terminal domain-containing protein [Xanthomonadaceae bacterium]|nr:HipA N-terminal domain-containing protein [Xanthomonadaceae bacterium]
MSDPGRLNLWHEQRLVGWLWRNPVGAIGFTYHPDWLADGFAVSRSLPLGGREFPPEEGAVLRPMLPPATGSLQRASPGWAAVAALADLQCTGGQFGWPCQEPFPASLAQG